MFNLDPSTPYILIYIDLHGNHEASELGNALSCAMLANLYEDFTNIIPGNTLYRYILDSNIYTSSLHLRNAKGWVVSHVINFRLLSYPSIPSWQFLQCELI